jgi:hypothetical protein
MACDAGIPIKPSPMANAEAARIFIDLPFFLKVSREAAMLQQMRRSGFTNGASGGGASGGGASPNGDDASPSDGGPNGGDASDAPTAPLRA